MFDQFLVDFRLPGVPGMALGTLGDRLCAGTPEKVDLVTRTRIPPRLQREGIESV